MASPGFYLLAYTTGTISQAISLLIILIALLVSLNALINGKHSKMRFLALFLSIIPLVLSRGYLTSYLPTPIIIQSGNLTDYVITIVASVLKGQNSGPGVKFYRYQRISIQRNPNFSG